MDEHGEIHCLLCGRYLADIAANGSHMRLIRPRNGPTGPIRIRLQNGRLYCTHCGGRAFVEWDLLPSGQTSTTREAA